MCLQEHSREAMGVPATESMMALQEHCFGCEVELCGKSRVGFQKINYGLFIGLQEHSRGGSLLTDALQ